jgi:PAS domain S-box-containing protein
MKGPSDVPPLVTDAAPSARPESDDRYRQFLALSGNAIARFTLDQPVNVGAPQEEQVAGIAQHSRIADCNELFAHIYDRDAAAMVGRLLPELMPQDDPERLEGIRQFVRAGYRLVDGEEVHRLEDGSSRWVNGSALGVIQEGRLLSYWLTLTDITARKQAEEDRERRGRILEAVAFGAAQLLVPGPWLTHIDLALERLGRAVDVSRIGITRNEVDPDHALRGVLLAEWTAPDIPRLLGDPRIKKGIRWQDVGLGHRQDSMRQGQPMVAIVSRLSEEEQALFKTLGTKSFAAVPILTNGQWWGAMGIHEMGFERQWSGPEIEALKAAAAVLAAAIERERAEEAIRESEERFERLAAAAFEGIAITEGGVFIDANEQLAGLLGYSVADLVGREVMAFVADEDRERVKASLKSASEEPYQHLAQRRDGSVFPVEVRARALPHRGRTVRVSAINDVSARVMAKARQSRLEGELRQAAEEWRQTFDALDLSIVLADAEGRVVRLNRAAREFLTGSAYGDTVGRRLEELSDREPWRAVWRLHGLVGESRVSVVQEAHEGSNGRSFYLLGSPWFRGEGEPPWRVITFRDVTDFMAMQSQLRRARAMEALGSLVAGVAHEVRNPLFSISATVDALESELETGAEFTEGAALLRSQVDRLNQLMRDLLDYGKPSVLRRGPTRLLDVVRRAVRSCAALARERQVRVSDEVAEDLPALDIDAARVEQALENLLANAIQHSPRDSVVRIVGSLDTEGPKPRARCAVEDEGPGLSGENLKQAFEPFFSRRKGGTGLGLPIVQRVAEAHGGDVFAENRPGAGARFTLILPVGSIDSPAEAPDA